MSDQNNRLIYKRQSVESPSFRKLVWRSFSVRAAFSRASAEGILKNYELRGALGSVKFICWESTKRSLLFGLYPSTSESISDRLNWIKSIASFVLDRKFEKELESEARLKEMEKIYPIRDMSDSDDLVAHTWKTNKKIVKNSKDDRMEMATRIKTWVSMAKAYLDN